MAFYFWTFAIGQNIHRNGRFPTPSSPSTPFPPERGENTKTAMAAFLPLPPKGVGLVFSTLELQQTNNFEKVWAVKLN